MRVMIAVCALAGAAHADVSFGLQLAGGIDGGPIAGPRAPGAIAETGMFVEALDTGSGSGIGTSIDLVHRTNEPFGRADEIKIDGMYRYANKTRKIHAGIGFGMRVAEQLQGAKIYGYDMFHVDVSGRIVNGAAGKIDLFTSETVGCYHDSYTMPAAGDAAAQMTAVGCLDTLSITFLVGVRTTLSSR